MGARRGCCCSLYAAPLFVLIYYLDLYEREPLSVAFAAFLWGAFAATALALDAGGWDEVLAQVDGAGFAARWAPALTAPVIEELLKGAGIVLLYLIVRDEVDDVMDGFVYGALCGLGFAVVEDVVYFMAAFGGTPAGRAARASTSACSRAACTATCCTRASWGWRSAWSCRGASRRRCASASPSPPGSSCWRCSATSCGTRRA